MYLPPNWLHKIVPLQGGGTPGIEFMSVDFILTTLAASISS